MMFFFFSCYLCYPLCQHFTALFHGFSYLIGVLLDITFAVHLIGVLLDITFAVHLCQHLNTDPFNKQVHLLITYVNVTNICQHFHPHIILQWLTGRKTPSYLLVNSLQVTSVVNVCAFCVTFGTHLCQNCKDLFNQQVYFWCQLCCRPLSTLSIYLQNS